MGFVFFILVNATLFIRPGEIVPALAAAEEGPLRIYYFLILAAFVFSIPELLKTFLGPSLDRQPMLLCVLGIFATCVTSHLANGNSDEALESGVYFAKVVVYFLLLISVLNTAARCRRFLFWLLCFCTILATIVVLQYHEIITLPTLQQVIEKEQNQYTGEETAYSRLQGSGIFQDPNEMGVILACAAALVCYELGRGGAARFWWLGPLALFLYDIYLTRSRGAFLALVSGLGVVAWFRLGWRRTLLLALCGLPLVLLLGGRQTELSATGGTGQLRIQTWSDWFHEFRTNPFFGNGMELGEKQSEEERAAGAEFKRVAHNSFLHGFANLGFVGGSCFLGAFFLAWWSLWRLRPQRTFLLDAEQRRVYPCLFGMLAAYTVGMMTLSLPYVVPTYLIIGLPLVFARDTASYPPLPALRFDLALLGRLFLVSVLFLAALYLVVRLLLRLNGG